MHYTKDQILEITKSVIGDKLANASMTDVQKAVDQLSKALGDTLEPKSIKGYEKEIMQAKEQVLNTSKRAFEAKMFTGTSGNLSVCIRKLNIVAITPTSVRYETMTIDDIVIIDLKGNVIEGKHGPSSEHRLHCMLYEAKPDIAAVVHTHSPYAAAFSVLGESIPPVLVEMIMFLGGEVPCAKLALQGTDEVGQTAVDAMGKGCSALIANHGVVVVGENINQAYVRAEYVEEGAQICTLASQNGEIKPIPDSMKQKLLSRM